MREKLRLRISPRLRTIRVLPKPGTPSSKQWPPHTSAMKTCSISSSWPTMKRAISDFNSSKARRALCIRCSISVTDSIVSLLQKVVGCQWPAAQVQSLSDNQPLITAKSFFRLALSQRHKVVLNRLLERLRHALAIEFGFRLTPIGCDHVLLLQSALAGRRFAFECDAAALPLAKRPFDAGRSAGRKFRQRPERFVFTPRLFPRQAAARSPFLSFSGPLLLLACRRANVLFALLSPALLHELLEILLRLQQGAPVELACGLFVQAGEKGLE